MSKKVISLTVEESAVLGKFVMFLIESLDNFNPKILFDYLNVEKSTDYDLLHQVITKFSEAEAKYEKKA